MPTTKALPVKDLTLDPKNYRTVPQKNEAAAIHALIAIDTEWFWALMESLLDDGYLPTENILVLDGTKKIVKEGNRRIAALKIIHGLVKANQFSLPENLTEKIGGLTKAWKANNASVPCAIYSLSEASAVDKIVTLTHGKGEKAGRAKWKAVARARHARDMNGSSEPALDLLEKYLVAGKNLSQMQAERWAGDFPLTVVDEAVKRLASRLGHKSAKDLSLAYPTKVQGFKTAFDKLLHAIGTEVIGFKEIRSDKVDFAVGFGFPPLQGTTTSGGSGTTGSTAAAASGTNAASNSQSATASTTQKPAALALNDPKSLSKTLAAFTPVGANRGKVVALLIELRKLKLEDHPYAFTFLLRSMFEISAKAYCLDHKASGGPSATKSDGTDVTLANLLRDIVKHLTANMTDKAKLKVLHGALTEIASANGFLSVTSMNQLVHNPQFSIKPSDISIVFNNVFPLLEEMNK